MRMSDVVRVRGMMRGCLVLSRTSQCQRRSEEREEGEEHDGEDQHQRQKDWRSKQRDDCDGNSSEQFRSVAPNSLRTNAFDAFGRVL
jgi:hypothetical protein